MFIKPDFTDKKTLEKYSSAFTLSDMEIFIFPELFYPLIIANIMSPVIWKWRDDPWFKDIEKKSFNFKVNRIKQYIIQNYVFNLDLETWGLTTKEKEIERFSDFFDTEVLKRSNALFGYEGDKYYYDINIRKHFGLDKFTTNAIPYWKTETIEAMNAFKYKENFASGAGECVSLSALYAAAIFIVGRIPLENIYLIATPLHSQNFIDVSDGVITNNRRIVTKTMWFNGTTLTEKARRALENEQVTIVSHISGFNHFLHDSASIDKQTYLEFCKSLNKFLKADIDPLIISNFLRNENKYRGCFQYCHVRNGKKYYIELDRIFEYEHNSTNNFSGNSRLSLLKEIDIEEYDVSPHDDKIVLNDFEEFLDKNKNLTFEEIEEHFFKNFALMKCDKLSEMFQGLRTFTKLTPRLPSADKNYYQNGHFEISLSQNRDEIINYIKEISVESETACLSLYIYRHMNLINWLPYFKASLERNPVSLLALHLKSIEEVYQVLLSMDNNSIYDTDRLALPDEVWNFQRGDGIEKAVLFASFLLKTYFGEKIIISIENEYVSLTFKQNDYKFTSLKNLRNKITIEGKNIFMN